MTKIASRRSRLLGKAKAMLESNFVAGYWIRFPDGSSWSPGGWGSHAKKLESLRAMLKKYPNPPECSVCAEGAIYLACASDPEATGEDVKTLLGHGRKRARGLFKKASIPEVNDSMGKEPAVQLLGGKLSTPAVKKKEEAK